MPEQHDIYTWEELVEHMNEWEDRGCLGHPLEYYGAKGWCEIGTRTVNIRENEYNRLAIGYRPKPFPEYEKVWIEAYIIKNPDGHTVLSSSPEYDDHIGWTLYPEDCNIVEDAPGTWVPQSWDEMIWASNNPRCYVEYKEIDSGDDWMQDLCHPDDYKNYKNIGLDFINGGYQEHGDTYTHRVTGPRPLRT